MLANIPNNQHFPYYKATDDRWKNSVRHNLSINPYFRKGGKVAQGAGHLWRVAKKDENSYVAMQKRQRMSSYLANTAPVLDEVQLATASIEVKESLDMEREDSGYEHLLLSSSQDMSLERSAEEILNGVKKDVEVQYLVPSRDATGEDCTVETLTLYPMDPCYPNPDPDFLNPVSKEVVVEESGLSTTADHLGAPYIITDLNPVSLGLNIEDADAIFANDINFQYFELS
uniref:(California timema) hypothetical protein n=1 Tax=Timema californicum TaxID=61474 RepID=A0A7R9P904_TIMCA|nr:unnamed protein product [Timema californicum]